jgi:glycosyltransferase involved in cell wall biosynthesis
VGSEEGSLIVSEARSPDPATRRVLVLSSEPLRRRRAGIGLRYEQISRALGAAGVAHRLASPATVEEMRELGLEGPGVELRSFVPGGVGALVDGCDAAVAQGQLANDLVLGAPDLPIAIDLYDPWMVENLHYAGRLGLDPYRNDHATWVLQLSRGDFFLCSSREQRLFYLGFLTAVGRVNPRSIEGDPNLERLIAEVPFALPVELPEHRPWLEPVASGERRLLFGGIYDWYDPATVLRAMELSPWTWTLLVVRSPSPEATPQERFREFEADCRARGWWGGRVQPMDWVPSERRFDLLRDVDAMVALHRPGVESELAFRTRFLDALAVGCPIVATEGAGLSTLLAQRRAAWLVPAGDAAATASALVEATTPGAARAMRIGNGLELARQFRSEIALQPLIEFCRRPWRDRSRDAFATQWPTRAPADSLRFRLRRRWNRSFGTAG